jgi:Ca-activated chloride channel family protein
LKIVTEFCFFAVNGYGVIIFYDSSAFAVKYLTALALLIVAAARPQLGSKLREEKAKGVEMMLVVDVSNSMLAEDFEPNRLERTKYAINRLFEGLQQERVGLVAFAGEPKVQLPITSDYRMAQAFAKRLSPTLVGEQGTAIGKALQLAALSFSSQSEKSRVIVLITDGENHEDDAIAAAQMAKEQGIRIYTIGIGTPEGAPIEIGGEFVKDENNEIVVSKLGEQMLQEMATITEGAYVRASKQDIGLDEVVKSINQMEKSELSTVRYEEYNEQYQYPLAVAMVLLLLEFIVLSRRNPRLRKFNIFRDKN